MKQVFNGKINLRDGGLVTEFGGDIVLGRKEELGMEGLRRNTWVWAFRGIGKRLKPRGPSARR